MGCYDTGPMRMRIMPTCAYCGDPYEIPFDDPYCSANCAHIDARFRRLREQMRNDKPAKDDDDQRPIDPQTTNDQE